MIDKESFIKKMKVNKDTRDALATYLGCTVVSLTNKINGKQFFTAPELSLIYERYSWTPVEFLLTFISKEVQCSDVLLGVEKVIVDNSVEN